MGKKSKKVVTTGLAREVELEEHISQEEHPAMDPAAEGGADDDGEPTVSVTAKRKKRKRRRNEGGDDAELSPEERERRQRQRELRETALKARSEGREYVKPKKEGKPKKRKQDEAAVDEAKEVRRSGRSDRTTVAARQQEPEYQVVVIPIYWNLLQRRQEKARVLALAGEIEEMVLMEGISCVQDASQKRTPGQKMHMWELKGTSVRIEVGPRDVDAHSCIVAKTTVPGQVAKKTTCSIGREMLTTVRDLLDGGDLPESALRASHSHPASGRDRGQALRGRGTGRGRSDRAAESTDRDGEQADRKGAGGQADGTGDDLGDTFEGVDFGSLDADETAKSKKVRKKAGRQKDYLGNSKRAQADSEGGTETKVVSSGSSKDARKKPKPKVVKF